MKIIQREKAVYIKMKKQEARIFYALLSMSNIVNEHMIKIICKQIVEWLRRFDKRGKHTRPFKINHLQPKEKVKLHGICPYCDMLYAGVFMHMKQCKQKEQKR